MVVDDDDDDDEYEVVGYADDRAAHAAHASTSLHSAHATPKTTRTSASKTSSAARKAPPIGFDWHGDASKPAWNDVVDDEGEGDGEGDGALARRAAREDEGEDEGVRTKDLFRALEEAVGDEDVDDIVSSPIRGDGGSGNDRAGSVTPRRSPRIRRASVSASLSGTPNAGGEDGRKRARLSEGAVEREAREAALLAEALGVSAAQAEVTRAAMSRKALGAASTTVADAQGGGPKAKKAPRAKKTKEPKKAPADKSSRAKAKVPAPAGGSVLGRLNLLTQTKVPLMMRASGEGDKRSTAAAEAEAEASQRASDDTANAAPSTMVVEDEIAMDDIVDDDDAADDAGRHMSDEDDVPMTMPQTNEAQTTGLGALSRLPKMSSPTFIPRSSVGASMNSQRTNRSRNAGLLTTRLQRVLANAKAQHAQFLKRVGSAQPPSSRGALLFYINTARLDASMTNCAGAICDLEKATNAEGDEDVEFARAIVIFNSTQAQELGLERGRRVAIYPPWREVDLPETTDAVVHDRGTSAEVVPRVILCCENVLRLD